VSNGVEQSAPPAAPVDLLLTGLGVVLFAWWLLNTSLGRTALAGSRPRRNRMGPLLPFMMFFLWIAATALLQALTVPFARRLDEARAFFLTNFAGTLGSLATVALALVVAHVAFARGLRGFGLRLKTIPKDLAHAFLTLLAVWPLVMAMMSLTVLIMRLFNKSFEVPQHEALQVITESASLPLQILMIVLAVAVAPLVEETLFRGLIQTMLRSYLGRPWPAIGITSLLFAAIHADPEHWPALFVLAMGLGYTYEKSSSLLRPIFMHAMFNGASIVAALLESAPK
jgi:membrane protease YdiL (CAAX protease family)